MKNIVKTLVQLALQAEPLRRQIDEQVKRVAIEWSQADSWRYQHGVDRPTKTDSINSWSIDGGGMVTVRWSETWNYGGYADGDFDFPAKYIYDADALVQWTQDCRAVQKSNEADEAARQREIDRAQLERLQAKLAQA